MIQSYYFGHFSDSLLYNLLAIARSDIFFFFFHGNKPFLRRGRKRNLNENARLS